MARQIDLNCDMGEGFGIYRLGNDEEMMRHVTSINVACGFHAGDPHVMRRTVGLAQAARGGGGGRGAVRPGCPGVPTPAPRPGWASAAGSWPCPPPRPWTMSSTRWG